MNKAAHILEIIWLVLGIISMILGIHKTLLIGFNQGYFFFIISAVSFVMYFFRYYLRKSQGKK